MTYSAKERQILDQVTAALHGHYGERLSRVVLFGSRARRDHREDSDYDILVVLKGNFDVRSERQALTNLTLPIDLDHDAVVYCCAMDSERFAEEDSILLRNIRAEGVSL
ncbi:MAG: nucleotidyltransferase domain-containing protein [Chthoniobacteraceae bacterium]